MIPHAWQQTRNWLPALLAVVLASLCGGRAAAQVSFFWSPPSVDLVAPPGGKTGFRAYLVNSSSQIQRFRIVVQDVAQQRSGVYSFLEMGEGDKRFSCSRWLKVTPEEVTLEPGEGATFTCELRVPRGQTSGGRYAAVSCIPAPRGPAARPAQGGLGQISIEVQTSTIVFLVVARSRPTMRCNISNLKVESQPGGSVAFTASLTNEGNIHVRGQGRLVIRSPSGRRLAETRLGRGRGTVLPGAIVDFKTMVREGIPIGDYTAEAVIRFHGRAPAIARAPFSVSREAISSRIGRGLALEVDPEFQELKLPPRASRTIGLSILNLEPTAVHLEVRTAELAQGVDGQFDVLEEDERAPRSALPWLSVRTTELDLPSGARRRIALRVQVPENQPPGGYCAAVLVEATAEAGPEEVASGRLVSAALVTVMPESEATVEVGGVTLVPTATGAQPSFDVTVQNPSDAHAPLYSPTLMVLTRQKSEGKVPAGLPNPEPVQKATYEGSQGMLIPGATRMFSFTLPPLPPGDYTALVSVGYGGKQAATGKHDFTISPSETSRRST